MNTSVRQTRVESKPKTKSPKQKTDAGMEQKAAGV
jgi:hypothetical protein